MPATPMPESVRSTPSIPYNLYFHGLDKPHWSTTTDGMHPDQVAQQRAEKARALVGSARRRRAASLHDSIKRLERSITELSSLDETGLTDVAAQHIERRLSHTVSMCRSFLQDLNEATARYRDTELASATPPAAPEPGDLSWLDSTPARTRRVLTFSLFDVTHGDRYAHLPPGYEVEVSALPSNEFYLVASVEGHRAKYRVNDSDDFELRPPAAESDDQADADAEDLAEREAEDLDAAADARATDQVITALATRKMRAELEHPERLLLPDEPDTKSFPTPADIAKGAVTPVRSHTVWPFQ